MINVPQWLNVVTSWRPSTGLFLQVLFRQDSSGQLSGKQSDFRLSDEKAYTELGFESQFMQRENAFDGAGCIGRCSAVSFEMGNDVWDSGVAGCSSVEQMDGGGTTAKDMGFTPRHTSREDGGHDEPDKGRRPDNALFGPFRGQEYSATVGVQHSTDSKPSSTVFDKFEQSSFEGKVATGEGSRIEVTLNRCSFWGTIRCRFRPCFLLCSSFSLFTPKGVEGGRCAFWGA